MTPGQDRFSGIRDTEFRGMQGAAYFNAAAVGPLPERSRRAMEEYNRGRTRVHEMVGADFEGPAESLRENAARLLNADTREIAFAANTSVGINIVALGLRVQQGAKLLVSDREFPANMYPWMHRERFDVEVLPTDPNGWLDEERFIERIRSGGVSIVALSSVQFDNGFRADLPRIGAACREAGAFFVIDAIQSLGVLPFDVESCQVDVVATGGHKWLLGPFGAGFVYVSEEALERIEPVNIGWTSMKSSASLESVVDYEWSFVPGARRLEVGTIPLQDLVGLSQSISLLLEAGPAAIEQHVDGILAPLREWLLSTPEVEVRTSFEPGRRSGIISFVPPQKQKTLEALQRAGVFCSIREGAVRVAAHFYNTDEDVARLLEVLDTQARKGWG